MENIREIEICPYCEAPLEHIQGGFLEDVFGCPNCNIEVNRNDALILIERYCPFCKNWYNWDEGHSCWEGRSGLY